jgi:NAD+ kinase
MPPIRRLAFVVNAQKSGAAELAAVLAASARAAGVEVVRIGEPPAATGWLAGQDACCVIGGDGTILGVAGEAARARVPVIGVNRGGLGFLTTFSDTEARENFAALLAGSFQISPRSLLTCTAGASPGELALNEVLIKAEDGLRLVRLEVVADGELVTEYSCDGLIFSTPTGSTAYNLSAGGPIIHPDSNVIAMTPICPHTLSNRSIIFRDSVKLRVLNRTPGTRVQVAIDGHVDLRAAPSESVNISISRVRLPLAQKKGYSHFAVVRTKLKWSGGAAERDF